MSELNKSHYQDKLAVIQARNLSITGRFISLLFSIGCWVLLYQLVTRIQYLWVPYVIEIQKFSHVLNSYLTYFFATLFIIVWFYLLYQTFQWALKYLLR
ncbi:MAG: hypothetical protein ACSHWU_02165, partial [Marinicella sp.]